MSNGLNTAQATRNCARPLRLSLTATALAALLASCGGGGAGLPGTATDTQRPAIISLAGVTDGADISGVVPIDVVASDNVGVTSLGITVDGTLITSAHSSHLQYQFDTTQLADGPCTVAVAAGDAAGNQVQTAVSVHINNAAAGVGGKPNTGSDGDAVFPPAPTPPDPSDKTPPTSIVTGGIADNQKVWDSVNIFLIPTDNKGIWWCELLLDGQRLKAETGATLSLTWDSNTIPDGEHTFVSRAYDRGGNMAASSIRVLVANEQDNAPPTFAQSQLWRVEERSGVTHLRSGIVEDHHVAEITVDIEGQQVYRTTTEQNLDYTWDTTQYPDGTYLVTYTVKDDPGNIARLTSYIEVQNNPEVNVTGTLLAPNGVDPIADREITIFKRIGSDAPDYGFYLDQGLAAPYDRVYDRAYTDGAGRFTLHHVRPGQHRMVLTPGPLGDAGFKLAALTTIPDDGVLPEADTTLAGSGSAVPHMAVVTGDGEAIQDWLARLGYGQVDANGKLVLGTQQFLLVDGNESLPDGTYPNFTDFVQSSQLDSQRLLFICSGEHFNAYIASNSAARQRLSTWLSAGGATGASARLLYCGGQAYDVIEQTFPALISFGAAGMDGYGTAPEPLGAAAAGPQLPTPEMAFYADTFSREVPHTSQRVTGIYDWMSARGVVFDITQYGGGSQIVNVPLLPAGWVISDLTGYSWPDPTQIHSTQESYCWLRYDDFQLGTYEANVFKSAWSADTHGGRVVFNALPLGTGASNNATWQDQLAEYVLLTKLL